MIVTLNEPWLVSVIAIALLIAPTSEAAEIHRGGIMETLDRKNLDWPNVPIAKSVASNRATGNSLQATYLTGRINTPHESWFF